MDVLRNRIPHGRRQPADSVVARICARAMLRGDEQSVADGVGRAMIPLSAGPPRIAREQNDKYAIEGSDGQRPRAEQARYYASHN
jgi:hypothetical protein